MPKSKETQGRGRSGHATKGHIGLADTLPTNEDDKATVETQGKGRTWIADAGLITVANTLPTNEDDKAIVELPQGLSKAAKSSSPEQVREALVSVPNGHLIVAKRTNKDGQAKTSVPKGRGPSASPSLTDTASLIRAHHRKRCYAMEQRKRSDLSLGAFLRMHLGWSLAIPEAEQKRIATQAAALIKHGEAVARGKADKIDEPAYDEVADIIEASIASRAPSLAVEKAAEKEMKRLAKTLPVWEWAGGVRGFGELGLAIIVAEAGDLSKYPKKGHLWKRMGLAVMGDGDGKNDIRQGGLKKGAAAEDWIAHGYNRQRRSRMFTIGDAMIKSGEFYRQIYLDRKEYERAKLPDGKPIVLHRRAQRYMEKLLLRDLWQQWRGAFETLPKGHLVTAPHHTNEVRVAA